MMTSHPGRYVIRRLAVPYKHTQGQGNDEGHSQRITVLDSDNDSTEEDSEEVIEASVSHVRDPCGASPPQVNRDRDRDRDRDRNDGSMDYHKHSRGRDDRDSHSYIRVSTYSRLPPRDRPDEAPRRHSGHHPRHRHSADRPGDDTRRHGPSQRVHGPHYRGHKSRHEGRDRHEKHERRDSRPDAIPWDDSAQDSSSLLDLESLLRRIGIFDEDDGHLRGSRPGTSTNTTGQSSSSHAKRHQTHDMPRQSRWDDGRDDHDDRHDDAHRDWDDSHRRYRDGHDDDHADWYNDEDFQTGRRTRVRSRSFSSRREFVDRDHGNQDQDQERDLQDHYDTARDAAAERQRQQQKTFFKALKYAVKAGTVAAINSSGIPGDWIGDKGSRVATAAIGAALVDTFFNHNYPKRFNGLRHTAMRQVAERTIRNLTEPIFQRAAENRGRQRRRSY